MKHKILSGLFVLALLATGCISEFNAELPDHDEQILVVEGNVVGDTDAIFYLSKSFPLNSPGVPEEIFNVNANLTVVGSNGYKSSPAIYLGRGSYRVSVGELDDEVEYGIQIEYDGNTYQSTFSKPFHTPEIDSVSWIQPEEAGTVFFHVSTHDDAKGAKFFMWNYTENWEISAYYYTTIFLDLEDTIFYSKSPAPYYYCWKSYTSNRFLIGSTESLLENRIINRQLYGNYPDLDRFSMLYSVTVYQTAISKNAFDYYQNRILLNEEMGGLFTPQPSELRGNINCITDPSKKVMGYVEIVKNTTQKRIFIKPGEISRPRIYYNCDVISNDSVKNYLDEYNLTYADFYRMGYRPAGEASMMGNFPDEWALVSCTDCTSAGGTKNKPDFWPNDHQ